MCWLTPITRWHMYTLLPLLPCLGEAAGCHTKDEAIPMHAMPLFYAYHSPYSTNRSYEKESKCNRCATGLYFSTKPLHSHPRFHAASGSRLGGGGVGMSLGWRRDDLACSLFPPPECPCWHLTHVLLACVHVPIVKQKGCYCTILFQVMLPARPGLSRSSVHFVRLKGTWAIIPNKLTSPQKWTSSHLSCFLLAAQIWPDSIKVRG